MAKTDGECVWEEDFAKEHHAKKAAELGLVDSPEIWAEREKAYMVGFALTKAMSIKVVLMPALTCFAATPWHIMSIDSTLRALEGFQNRIKEKHQKQGAILDDEPDGLWAMLCDGGHQIHAINFCRFEPMDPKARIGELFKDYSRESAKYGTQHTALHPTLDETMFDVIKYCLKLHKVIDDRGLVSDSWTNVHAVVFDEWD